MSVWRYIAVAGNGGARLRRQVGELAGESAAAVRAMLRRQGLQVLELREARAASKGGGARLLPWRAGWQGHLRHRRQLARAELYDGLATMLDSGLPLVQAIDTVLRGCRGGLRTMMLELRDDVQSGLALAQAMAKHGSWFDRSEVAMVEAAQHGGHLARVLCTLAERHERSGELSQRLLGALAYPLIVAMVGVGVVIFISTKTLPNLVQVLSDARVEVPRLTARVMFVGQTLAAWWWALALFPVGTVVALLFARALLERLGVSPGAWRMPLPKVVRRLAIAALALRWRELLQSGVPLVEALRILVPTMRLRALREALMAVAARVERGEEIFQTLDDETWFDEEFSRLVAIGQASGELETLLERLGHRYERQARRLIDRLTSLLEPAVILTLAALIGMVVMAAVLPIVRLQEIL